MNVKMKNCDANRDDIREENDDIRKENDDIRYETPANGYDDSDETLVKSVKKCETAMNEHKNSLLNDDTEEPKTKFSHADYRDIKEVRKVIIHKDTEMALNDCVKFCNDDSLHDGETQFMQNDCVVNSHPNQSDLMTEWEDIGDDSDTHRDTNQSIPFDGDDNREMQINSIMSHDGQSNQLQQSNDEHSNIRFYVALPFIVSFVILSFFGTFLHFIADFCTVIEDSVEEHENASWLLSTFKRGIRLSFKRFGLICSVIGSELKETTQSAVQLWVLRWTHIRLDAFSWFIITVCILLIPVNEDAGSSGERTPQMMAEGHA